MIDNEQGKASVSPPIYTDTVNPANRQANIMDEIPDNIGSKAMPFWVKGLLALIVSGVVAGGAYFYSQQQESGLINSVDAFIGAESAEAPISEKEITLDLSNTESDATSQDFDRLPPPIEGEFQSYSTPIIGGDSEINLLDTNVQPEVNGIEDGAVITIRDSSDNAIQREEPSIENTAENMSQKIAPETIKPEMYTAEAVEKASEIAIKDALEKYNENQIIIVKTSLELQGQAKTRLTGLLKSLDSLSSQIQQEEKSKAVVRSKPKQTSPKVTQKPAKTEKKTPIKPSNIKLLGIDLWAGERFAQIEYNKELQLVAINESVGEWRVISIATTKVTLKNKQGDLIELTSE